MHNLYAFCSLKRLHHLEAEAKYVFGRKRPIIEEKTQILARHEFFSKPNARP